jgi:hypothetical protein
VKFLGKSLLVFGLLSGFLMPSLAMAQIEVVYPRPMVNWDQRQNYASELLKMALAQSGKDYQLQASESIQKQKRALKNMETGSGIDVVWTVTSIEREQRLRPIRIPIDKGLAGWRIPLIRKVDVDRFEKVQALGDIQKLNAGQGHDWPDVEIFRHNGFNITSSSSYIGMFKMLASGRVDYFPRSVLEVEQEAKTHSSKKIVIDPNLLIIYPSALYFFVSPDSKTLAEDIENGLEVLIANGEFDKLFGRYFKDSIARLNLERRQVVRLENPLFPSSETLLERRELWLQAPSQK